MPSDFSGLLGTYYNGTDLSGPGIQRIDTSIDMQSQGDWASPSSPAPGISDTYWSATWQGKIQATTTGEYTFYITADDGFRFWVNDAYVDQWTYFRDSSQTVEVKTTLQAGQWYAIQLDYFQCGGPSKTKLEWSGPNTPRELIPSSQLSCENSPPVITAPGVQNTDESTPVYFSKDNGNAIQVSDPDTVNGTLQVTLHVDYGTLKLSGTDDLNFTSGSDGSGT